LDIVPRRWSTRGNKQGLGKDAMRAGRAPNEGETAKKKEAQAHPPRRAEKRQKESKNDDDETSLI